MIVKRFMASYSASRAALLEAWRFYRRRRAFLANGLCNVELGPEIEYKPDTSIPPINDDVASKSSPPVPAVRAAGPVENVPVILSIVTLRL